MRIFSIDLKEEPIVRRYQANDELDIVNLLNESFNGWPDLDVDGTPLDHWRWKYSDAPIREPIISICESRGRIAGCDHSISLRVKINEKIYVCDYSVDTAVHPDYRGKGLSTQMINRSNELRKKSGFYLLYWVTRNPFFIKAYSKIRPSFPHEIRNLVRIRDIGLQLRKMPMKNAWLMKLGFYSAKGINFIRNIVRSYSPIDQYLITEKDCFDEKINTFWDEISVFYDFIVERRLEYLKWRYCDPRGGRFHLFLAESENRIFGYCIACINRKRPDYPVGYIVDLLVNPENLDVAHSLLCGALEYFDVQGVNIVNCLVIHGNPLERVLNKAGFLHSRVRLNFFYNTMGNPDNVKQVTADRAHFSYGDIDSLPSGYLK